MKRSPSEKAEITRIYQLLGNARRGMVTVRTLEGRLKAEGRARAYSAILKIKGLPVRAIR